MSEDARQEKIDTLIDELARLATYRGNDFGQDPDRLKDYAEDLVAYPLRLMLAAVESLRSFKGDRFPQVTDILDAAARLLIERGMMLDAAEAWKIGRREANRWHAQTRPTVTYSHPAIEKAVREVGGEAAFFDLDDNDHKSIRILQQAFIKAYREASFAPPSIAFSVKYGARLVPPLKAIEIPGDELAKLDAGAKAAGRELPAAVTEPTVVALPLPPEPVQLPSGAIISPEKQAALAGMFKALGEGMRMK